jgi:hypothetical protein
VVEEDDGDYCLGIRRNTALLLWRNGRRIVTEKLIHVSEIATYHDCLKMGEWKIKKRRNCIKCEEMSYGIARYFEFWTLRGKLVWYCNVWFWFFFEVHHFFLL